MKITEMNVKLDKLLGLINEMEDLRTRLTEVENENKSLKEAMKSTNEEFEEMKTTSITMCTIANKNTEDIQSLEKEVLMLKRRNIKLEAYIAENEGEDRNTESLVRNVLREKMKIPKEDEEYIRFERIHRIATRKPSSKPRPIIAKFSHYQDKEFVWSFVKNLKGTNIGIANDFPKEIEEIQSKLYPRLKEGEESQAICIFQSG